MEKLLEEDGKLIETLKKYEQVDGITLVKEGISQYIIIDKKQYLIGNAK